LDRRFALGIAAVALLGAPASALAQTWPAGANMTYAAAGGASISSLAAPMEAPVWRAPPAGDKVVAWTPPSAPVPAVKPPPAEPLPLLANVKVPAKAEWSDDQGLSLHYAQLRYKQRF
jgi:hypothetical protein